MALPFDATLKELVQSYPQDWLAELNLFTTDPVNVLTPDLSTVTAFTDTVLEVGDRLVHLDFQTGPDPELPRRLLLYNGLLYHRYGMPVHSVVVLLRPRADRSDLTDHVRYEAWPGRGGMDFRFEVVRVWNQPMEALLTGPLGTVPLAPLGQVANDAALSEALPPVVEQLVHRIVKEAPPEQAPVLLTAAFILTGMRVAKGEVVQLFRGVRAMHESSAYEAILDEGRAEGELRATRALLLRLGRKHLGEPKEETVKALQAINDLERLGRFAERTHEVETWQELLDTP